MNSWTYIAASLRHFRRIHASVAAGVAVTTAVITGALLVGDSMRGSLRDLALGSLGRIDSVLIAEHPFRETGLLADDVQAEAAPLLLTQGSALHRMGDGEVRRAAQLQVIGVNDQFWKLAEPPMTPPIERGNQIALTADVAAELGVKVGDAVLLRIPIVESIPADSTLGEKEETAATRRLTVAAILDADVDASLARFALRPNQTAPRNAFVPLATMQSLLDLPGQINALAVVGSELRTEWWMRSQTNNIGFTFDAARRARTQLRPKLEDFGVTVKEISRGDSVRYYQIAADRLVLPTGILEAARTLFGKHGARDVIAVQDNVISGGITPGRADDLTQPVVTYLANRISAGDRRVPYSTVSGVDSTAALGPVVDADGKPIELTDEEIAINDWLAKELAVEVGDEVTLLWYDPETTHGELREHAPLTLKVRAVLPLAVADGKPTAAADPDFAPELPGVTDQASIDDWDLPFDLVETVRDEDEKYWDDYRTTPKAFVSHSLAAKLWSTRWGTESILRIPHTEGMTVEGITAALEDELNPAQLGMSLVAVRENALAAASGTTPFDGLFLGFSFFLMASAVMLTALLFRLGIEQRAREVGLLEALGTPLKKLRRLLLAEAALVAAIGAALGVLLGVGYARLMVYGLNTWWVAATAEPFLRLHVTPRSLVVGFAVGVLVALATIAWSLRRFSKLPARQLLAGDAEPALAAKSVGTWSSKWLPAALILAAIGLGFAGTRLEGEAQGGAFFGSGTLVLVGVLAAVRGVLRRPVVGRPTSMNLAGLAARNARRNPSRTMLALGLAATASFLIVAMSAFRLAPTDRGVGGFDLMATTDLPVLFNLSSESGRRELGFSPEDEAKLKDATIISFRVHDGQDASCLNLYKPTQPRILGVPPEMADVAEFDWVGFPAALVTNSVTNKKIWQGLEIAKLLDDYDPMTIEMVVDRNTAYYSLQLYKHGNSLVVHDEANQQVTLKSRFLLLNSVLQGDVLIGEDDFMRLFPETAGRRFFLIRRGETSPSTEELASLLETQLEDYGFDAVDARQRLAELLAVQNTYLSTFQSLGALGLLLGVVGLSVVQLRSIIERRGELALLQATGFRRRRLAGMVLAENLVLLVGGLAIGSLAALAAVLPHALAEQAGTPWATLAILLAIVAAVGSLAGWLASRVVLRAPLIPALRGD